MQNKLNEILELCIEKSIRCNFYSFSYCTFREYLIIEKVKDPSPYMDGNVECKIFHNLDEALEYMQNE